MDLHCSTFLELLSSAMSNFYPTNINEGITIVISMLMQNVQYIMIDTIDFKLMPFTSHYKLLFNHPRTESIIYTLYLVAMPKLLSIQASVTFENNTKYRCMLQIFPNNIISLNDSNQITFNKDSLSELIRIFRDSISSPLLQSVLKEKSLPELPDISNMPYQIQLKILKFLHLRDLMSLSLVSKQWHDLSKDPYLWRYKYLSRYTKNCDTNISQDWLKIFEEKYIEEKQQAKYSSHHGTSANRLDGIRMPTHSDIWPAWRPPIFDPFNVFFPEVIPRQPLRIGGPYDLFPHLPSQPDIVMNNLNGDFDIGRQIHSTLQFPFY